MAGIKLAGSLFVSVKSDGLKNF